MLLLHSQCAELRFPPPPFPFSLLHGLRLVESPEEMVEDQKADSLVIPRDGPIQS